MFTAPYSPYGASTPTSGGGIDDFLAKYAQNQPQQQPQQPQQAPSPISELDEFLASLPSDKRNAVEVSPEYHILSKVVEL